MNLLQEKLSLSGDIPSLATVSRMLSSIDKDDFCNAFMQWMTELLRTNGADIIIDGKAFRGGTERIKDGNTPYILNAIEAATNLVAAQLAIDTKENEQAAIPRLLDLLSLKDSLVTIDAAGTTTDINLAMLRKFVFNILQIARIRENSSDGFPEMMDSFADDSNKIQFYVLQGIESFY